MSINPDNLNGLKVEFVFSPVVNFAMHQNHVPTIRKIVITNDSETNFEDVQIEIVSEPEFAFKYSHRISLIKY